MRLRLTSRAARELANAIAYIEEKNPAAALRVLRAVERACELARDSPEIGRRQGQLGIRKLVVRPYPYLLYYRYEPPSQEVVILNVKHASRVRTYADA